MKSAVDAVRALPAGVDVSVTCSPTKGVGATLELVAEIAALGHHTVPHLAARMVESAADTIRLARRLDEIGVREVFVIAGDSPEPHGPYAGSFEFLRDLLNAAPALTHVGVAAYPDKHPLIDDATLLAELHRKQELLRSAEISGHATTQMCFNPDTVRGWLTRIRREGVDLPVHLGVAGVVDRTKLVSLGVRLGVGSSLRYLRKNVGVLKVFASSSYDPSQILEPLAGEFQALEVSGVHLFTFNQVAKTADWRRSVLERATGSV